VVFVDTDLPTLQQTVEDPTLSSDVAIDALRVDVLDASGASIEERTFVAPSALDWPISFGVGDGSAATQLRLRVYHSGIATPHVEGTSTTLEPNIVTTIDRFVSLPRPTSGISAARVTLHGDCIGRPASLVGQASFCRSASELTSTDLAADVSLSGDLSPGRSVVGTWSAAREIPCKGTAPKGTICVPGGLSVMGSAEFDGQVGRTIPYRLVKLTPFYMDQTEVTVGTLRPLLKSGAVSTEPKPFSTEPFLGLCSYAGRDVARNDALPLNCISRDDAIAVCKARGGTLETEAQFEHAARGRGQGRPFPWGAAAPACCAGDFSRSQPQGPAGECKGAPLDHAGSHTTSTTCSGIGDESRDGILDLGGSLREWMVDTYEDYAGGECWSWAGYKTDPVCAGGSALSVRGGSWLDALAAGNATYHTLTAVGGTSWIGFRCTFGASP
jgi:formylglycine-generating enzyme required for sulfatase activity